MTDLATVSEPRHRVGGAGWTEPEDELLKKLHGEGCSYTVIAAEIRREFGRPCTRNSAIGRGLRIGLPKRINSPSVPRASRAKVPLPKELDQNPREVRRRFLRKNPDAPRRQSHLVLGNMMQRVAAGEPPRQPDKPLPTLRPQEASQFQCTLFDLTNETCRFPVGDAAGHQQMFCGAPGADLAAGQPYCGACATIAYTGPQPPRRRGLSFGRGRLGAAQGTSVNPVTDF